MNDCPVASGVVCPGGFRPKGSWNHTKPETAPDWFLTGPVHVVRCTAIAKDGTSVCWEASPLQLKTVLVLTDTAELSAHIVQMGYARKHTCQTVCVMLVLATLLAAAFTNRCR